MPIALLDYHDLCYDSYKVAALYFDRLAVALPATWTDKRVRDGSAVGPLLDAGLLRVIRFAESDMMRASLPLINAIAANDSALRERFEFIDFWPKSGFRTHLDEGWFPYGLATAIEASNLGYAKRDLLDDGLLLRTELRIGQMYRSALFDLIAQRELLSIASESECIFAGASDWGADVVGTSLLSPEGIYPTDVVPEVATPSLAVLSVRTVLPTYPEALSLKRILEIRRRNRSQLTIFQEFLDSIIRSGEFAELLGRRSTTTALQAAIQVEYERKVAPEIKLLEESYRRLGIATTWNALSLRTAVPPALAVAIGAIFPAGSLAQEIMLGTGVAFGTLSILREVRDKVKSLENAPTAYMHSLAAQDPLSLVRAFRKAKPRSTLGLPS